MQKNKIGISEEITRVGSIKNNLIQIKNNIDNKFIEIGATESNNLNEVAEKIGKIGGDLKKIAQGEKSIYLYNDNFSEKDVYFPFRTTGKLANISINSELNFTPKEIILGIDIFNMTVGFENHTTGVRPETFFQYTHPYIYIDSKLNNNEYSACIMNLGARSDVLSIYFDKITDKNIMFNFGIINESGYVDNISEINFTFKWIAIG